MFEIPISGITIYDISISYENMHLVLAVVGAIILIHLLVIKRSEKRAIKFSNYEILEEMVGKEAVREKNLIPLLLRTLVLVFIIFSLTNFQVTFSGYETNSDFVIAIDSSASMLSSDIKPTRLQRVKMAGKDLVKKMPSNTKIGLVTFGGSSEVKVSPTKEKENLKNAVSDITYSTEGGTATGDALFLAGNELEGSKGNKTIVLLTDGRRNVGVSVNESVEYLTRRDITVKAVGIGKAFNETTKEDFDIPEEFDKEDVTISQSGGYSPKNLQRIANKTNGKFLSVESSKDMDKIFEETVLVKEEITMKPTFYLLAASALLLMIEWALGATKYKTLP